MRGLRVAVCKPDHLGDFILALPALRTLSRKVGSLTLFIARGNIGLAHHYLPDVECRALDMPYLRRDGTPQAWSAAFSTLGDLRTFDLVLFLRRDGFLHPGHFAQWTDRALFIEDRDDLHQTQLEHAVVSRVAGEYDVDQAFFEKPPLTFPRQPDRVVLAIGAGFPHKKWSPLLWAQLGQMLVARGMSVRILSGPAEVAEAMLIGRAIGLRGEHDIFVGGKDLAALEQWLDESDVAIAADGGSAHLCATRLPVLGVFGPSPVARYAPIGANNRVVTRALECSPCVGFDLRTVNACMSRECLYGLRPESVSAALMLQSALPGEVIGLTGPDGAQVRFGLSAVRAA